MAVKLPRLHAHLQRLGCDMSIIATDWVLCLFSTSLPSEVSAFPPLTRTSWQSVRAMPPVPELLKICTQTAVSGLKAVREMLYLSSFLWRPSMVK